MLRERLRQLRRLTPKPKRFLDLMIQMPMRMSLDLLGLMTKLLWPTRVNQMLEMATRCLATSQTRCLVSPCMATSQMFLSRDEGATGAAHC